MHNLWRAGVTCYERMQVPLNPAENEREYRLIDQLMTAHAVLRDRYCRRGRVLSVLLVSLCLALNAFVFTTDDMLKRVFFGYISEPKIFVGFISIGLLILSIIGIRV